MRERASACPRPSAYNRPQSSTQRPMAGAYLGTHILVGYARLIDVHAVHLQRKGCHSAVWTTHAPAGC